MPPFPGGPAFDRGRHPQRRRTDERRAAFDVLVACLLEAGIQYVRLEMAGGAGRSGRSHTGIFSARVREGLLRRIRPGAGAVPQFCEPASTALSPTRARPTRGLKRGGGASFVSHRRRRRPSASCEVQAPTRSTTSMPTFTANGCARCSPRPLACASGAPRGTAAPLRAVRALRPRRRRGRPSDLRRAGGCFGRVGDRRDQRARRGAA